MLNASLASELKRRITWRRKADKIPWGDWLLRRVIEEERILLVAYCHWNRNIVNSSSGLRGILKLHLDTEDKLQRREDWKGAKSRHSLPLHNPTRDNAVNYTVRFPAFIMKGCFTTIPASYCLRKVKPLPCSLWCKLSELNELMGTFFADWQICLSILPGGAVSPWNFITGNTGKVGHLSGFPESLT